MARLGYWRARLAGAEPAELPTDRPRRATSRHNEAIEEAPVPAAARPLLDGTARHSGAGRHAGLLAAWATVLHRHTASTDLVIGVQTPVGTLLPVRLTVDPSAPFTELLDSALRQIDEATAHAADLPPPGSGWDELVRVVVAANPHGVLDIGVEFSLGCSGEGLTLRYDADVYHRSTAAWLLGHCATLLTAAAREPGRAVSRLPVQEQPTQPFASPQPHDGESLVDRFRPVVAEHGDLPAVRGPSGAYTYAELDAITTGLAHRVGRVAEPGSRIALLCDHDVNVAVGVWSALKAGVTYVPMDPRQPDGRLARILADADVAAVACDPALARRASRLAKWRAVVRLDPIPDDDATPVRVEPEALAYLLHTSGSTGRPKAVMQSHRRSDLYSNGVGCVRCT